MNYNIATILAVIRSQLFQVLLPVVRLKSAPSPLSGVVVVHPIPL
jgi:hypothetical protein